MKKLLILLLIAAGYHAGAQTLDDKITQTRYAVDTTIRTNGTRAISASMLNTDLQKIIDLSKYIDTAQKFKSAKIITGNGLSHSNTFPYDTVKSTIYDSLLVHLGGPETITGKKTFTDTLKIGDKGINITHTPNGNISIISGSTAYPPLSVTSSPSGTVMKLGSTNTASGADMMNFVSDYICQIVTKAYRPLQIKTDDYLELNANTNGASDSALRVITKNGGLSAYFNNAGNLTAIYPVQYKTDLSGIFTDNSLVNKKWVVDQLAAFSPGTPGLQAVITSNPALTQPNIIDAAGYNFKIDNTPQFQIYNSLNGTYYFRNTDFNNIISTADNTGHIYFGATLNSGFNLEYQKAGNNSILNIDSNFNFNPYGKITSTKPIKYTYNFNSLLDNNSLTPKKYVDSSVSAHTQDTTTIYANLGLKKDKSDSTGNAGYVTGYQNNLNNLQTILGRSNNALSNIFIDGGYTMGSYYARNTPGQPYAVIQANNATGQLEIGNSAGRHFDLYADNITTTDKVLEAPNVTGTVAEGATVNGTTYHANTLGAIPLPVFDSNQVKSLIPSIIPPSRGGTGINNGSFTLTMGGNIAFNGANAVTFTSIGNTNISLPTSGTMATVETNQTLINKNLADPTNIFPPFADSNRVNTKLASKLDTSATYVNNIVFNNSGLIHTSPATFSYSGHTATITQTLATHPAYNVLATGSSTAAPTWRTGLDSNYLAVGHHTENYYRGVFGPLIGAKLDTTIYNANIAELDSVAVSAGIFNIFVQQGLKFKMFAQQGGNGITLTRTATDSITHFANDLITGIAGTDSIFFGLNASQNGYISGTRNATKGTSNYVFGAILNESSRQLSNLAAIGVSFSLTTPSLRVGTSTVASVGSARISNASASYTPQLAVSTGGLNSSEVIIDTASVGFGLSNNANNNIVMAYMGLKNQVYTTAAETTDWTFKIKYPSAYTQEVMRLTSNKQLILNDSAGSHPSSQFVVNATTKGVILASQTTAQTNAISSPEDGELVYDNVTHRYRWFRTSDNTWNDVGTSAASILTHSTGTGLSGGNFDGTIARTWTVDLSTGIAGGQSVIGDINAGGNLTLVSTSNAIKGKIILGASGASAYDGALNFMGIGTASPTSQLHLAGNITAAAWTTNGIGLRYAAATYTDNSSSGTVANMTVHDIGIPTVAASSSTTFTSGSTFTIEGPPVSGSNVIISQTAALRILSGLLRADGGMATSSSTQASNFGAAAGTASATSSAAGLLAGGATSTMFRSAFNGGTNSVANANFNIGNAIFGAVANTTSTGAGSHPYGYNVLINAPTFTAGTLGTIADEASLIVNGAPTGLAPTNNGGIAKALWVIGGSRFEGMQYKYAAKSANYTITANDFYLPCNGTFTVTLIATPAGSTFIIKNTGSGTITVSGVNMDASSTKTLNVQYGGIVLTSNGTTYDVTGTF